MKKQIILYIVLVSILLPKEILANLNILNNRNLNVTLTEQKFQNKVDTVFENNPALLATYNKIQNKELKQVEQLPEYHNLLNSRELKILNKSPEMQEYMKEIIRNVNIEIEAIDINIAVLNSQTIQLQNQLNNQNLLQNDKLSQQAKQEIQDKINLNNSISRELTKQVNGLFQSLNNLSPLYFTDSIALNNLSDLTPIQKSDTLTTDMLLVSTANLNQLIEERINDLLLKTVGVAAGDQAGAMYGLWVKGLKSYVKQTQYKLTPGYKLNQHGLAIGLDFLDDLFGVAFTADRINTNLPNAKEAIDSYIANIYGLYKYTDNLFMDMQVKYGKSYIKKFRHNLNLSKDISRAKTRGDLYGGKIELGYSYRLQNNMYVIPTIGVSYDELRINGYKETGEGLNRKVDSRKVNRMSGLLGLKLTNYVTVNSYDFMPEIYVKLCQTLHSKNDPTVITIVKGMNPLITPSGKLSKTIYKIGVSSKFVGWQALELTLGYDIGISKKFLSNTGYISAKINF